MAFKLNRLTAFAHWNGWSEQGELLESGGERYLLSMMLGREFRSGQIPCKNLC